jgi:hypothetical protein
LILKKLFKIKDRIKVIAQNWDHPELVGQTGTVVFCENYYTTKNYKYLILFDNWKKGHSDGLLQSYSKFHVASNLNINKYWWLGGRDGDDMKLINGQQLEFDFDE